MMRIETVFAAAALTFAILVVPTAGSAQSLSTPSSDSSFLVAADTEQGQQQRTTDPSGIGFGVKAGVLFSSFRDARDDYKSSDGWQGGIFIGGNRPGPIGLQTELTYAKRGAKSGNTATDTYYLEIPLLIRANVGSSNRNTGASVYLFGGPAADILLKARIDDLDIKDNFKSLDWNVIAGVGIEVSRLLIEGRFNWGLSNVLEGPGNELKTKSFAVLGGLRFN
ncbi:MAG: porin family protein [Vicinamibacterales bacterium]